MRVEGLGVRVAGLNTLPERVYLIKAKFRWLMGAWLYASVARIVFPAGSRPCRSWAPGKCCNFGDIALSPRDHSYPGLEIINSADHETGQSRC
jgi:hypothetical protein